ncbi:Ger(x)C family spore germination protein [Bacillus haikouensis]|uniref:Ger(x)C family spore germination protein n=1 Tax=Bacillus haikouensis TaxID=1510468 RepID=UPI00155200FB|nr:Ger(x)C family spore germination protein [Bacillus haikouensis]NQD67130.1 Ger(x)C family spore germination protein [Bacillus haikouensis]
MRKRITNLTIILLLMTGCVEREILDDLNIETGKAYDFVDENTIRGTALFPVYIKDGAIENRTLSAEAPSTREVLETLSRKSQQPLVRGSLDIVLLGEKMAKKGVLDVADSLQRDASIGARVFLAITEGSAEDILNGNYGIRGNGMFISNLINQNIKRRELPETNLHMFLYDYYQDGQTPYLPIIKKVSDDTLEVTGVALFDKDKMVDTVSPDDLFFFKLLVDKLSEGSHVVKLGKKDGDAEQRVEAAVTSIKSKHKIKVENKKDPVKISIKITIRGIIKEYTGKKLTPKKIKEIEDKMSKDIIDQSLELFGRFQEMGIDPAGIGQIQKHGVRGFDIKEWEKTLYPNAEFVIKPDVQIVESGTVE